MKRLISAVMAVACWCPWLQWWPGTRSRPSAGCPPASPRWTTPSWPPSRGEGLTFVIDCTNVSEIKQSNWAQNYFSGFVVGLPVTGTWSGTVDRAVE